MSTGTVWRRGTIIATEVDSNELTYVVQVRWNYAGGEYVEADLVFTNEDIANGTLRRI